MNALLFSGGYDSTVLKKYLEFNGLDVKLFHANIYLNGILKNKGETKLVKENYEIDFETDLYLDTKEEYVPARNTMLVMSCANKLMSLNPNEFHKIFIGLIWNIDGFKDCSLAWVDAINTFLKVEFDGKVEVVAPFVEYTKDTINGIGNTLKVDIEKTFSCNFEDEQGNPCGKCHECQWHRMRSKYKTYLKRG